ncbi:MAG: molybdopterin-synthase sulfurylase [Verrucomicrobiaceae bacterium]|nr:molybdopterin-synthase sulfurylase [Verrucomicrobiaceae bacterium]
MSTATTLAEPAPLSEETTMGELLQLYPGAQRALFAKYHIGGCQSCGFSPAETIGQLCTRNDNIPVAEFVASVQASHDADVKLQVTPVEFATMRETHPGLKVLDARTREEHEAVKIEGAHLLTQPLIQEIFDKWDKTQPLVIYDHQGTRSLDAVSYFIGHGFGETKCLAGGIDAYSVEVDPSIPRYRVEIE